ncbi:AAA family ATPase [Paenibacillus barcinonensis]|uniref:AAA family ATPase n=1 Tax=Paenibacillus barcinonensis TaxID=198119 RepID=A0A2V4VGA6_PAEBA|nr:AAA family ATPase [Paenibacillus barcinonensis]PYE47768.1 putative ATPase [Paenibacillus barcinonensis]QKS59119.1 AAA family ATPase [Paenibacillus barcinonensis]
MIHLGEITLRDFIDKRVVDLQMFFPIAEQIMSIMREKHQEITGACRFTPTTLWISFEREKVRIRYMDTAEDDSQEDFSYISPEHTGRMRRRVDARSDLYILGVLLYELLSSELPFKAESANDWIYAHLAMMPLLPRGIHSSSTQGLNDLVMKLLAKSPDDRYQSVEGVAHDLHKCMEQWKRTGMIPPFTLGELDERARFLLPTRLYGREENWKRLIAEYSRSAAGDKALVFVGGPAGSGKSTLIEAFQSHIIKLQGWVIAGRHEPFQELKPYASLTKALAVLIRNIVSGGEEQILLWRSKLLKVLGQNGGALTTAISELTWIIGYQPPVEELSPPEATQRFQTLLGNLIRAFADEMRPLVIILEDLQWADTASLHLLRDLWNQTSLKHVLVVGTYRDNVLEEGHEFRTLFGTPSEGGAPGIQWNTVSGLMMTDIVRFTAEAFRVTELRARPLAEVLYRQTAGNPLYIKQTLEMYYRQKRIFFDYGKWCWEWDVDRIEKIEGAQDVIELIVKRFDELPEISQQLLAWGACLGASFDPVFMARLTGASVDQTEQALLPALQEGLIIMENRLYKFLHDQVQEAAYHWLADDQRKQIHLKIGRDLLQVLSGAEREEDLLFETVHHLNSGSTCMVDQHERSQLAELNLRAGKQAMASAAYRQALELFEEGLRLLEGEGDKAEGSLYFQHVLESSECRYFIHDAVQAEADLRQLLLSTSTGPVRTRIYLILIKLYTFHKRMEQATDTALEAMRGLGLSVPYRTSSMSILAEVSLTQLALVRWRSRLEKLPMSDDPAKQELAEIVMVSSAALFIVNPELAVVVFARYLRMSLKQGIGDAFSIALGSYAMTIAYGFKQYASAWHLVEVASHYADQSDRMLLQGRVQMIRALIMQYIRPQKVASVFERAVQLAMESGDRTSAGNSIACHVISIDQDLDNLKRVSLDYQLRYENTLLDEVTLNVLHISQRYVERLGTAYSEPMHSIATDNTSLEQLIQGELPSDEHRGNRYYLYTCDMEIAYIYGQYEKALLLAKQSEHTKANVLLCLHQKHCFYHALAIIAVYPEASEQMRSEHHRKLLNLLQRMKGWAKRMPEGALCKLEIMQAEYARLHQDYDEAARLYASAIRHARDYGEPKEEAIAAERAAYLYQLRNDPDKAEQYLRKAREAYQRWGAYGKVQSIENHLPAVEMLLSRTETEDVQGERNIGLSEISRHERANTEMAAALDLEVLKQTYKIPFKEMAESELFDAFLKLAIRNAAAVRGVVLLKTEGDWRIEARKGYEDEQGEIIPGWSGYAVSVVEFVMKTKEPVVCGSAEQSMFASDPYIQAQRPRSILCLPLQYLDQRGGVLYLENNLTPNAFTPEGVEILELILSRLVYLRLWQLDDQAILSQTGDVTGQQVLITTLTNRELEVLSLMAEGMTNKQIAAHMEITEGTVKSHANNIYGKLEVRTRVQAIKKARELQLFNKS